MRTVVFINPHSRRAAHSLEAVQNFFARHKKFEVVDFIITEDLGHFDSYIDRLKQHKNIACVIVGSGDGTIVGVLNALKDRKNLLYGFLPLGTTNAFARSLAVPLTLKKAFRILEQGHARPVCLGSVNGVLFANVTGVGLDAKTVVDMDTRLKRYFRSMAYNLSGLRALLHHKPVECELRIGTDVHTFLTHQLVAVNGNHYGPIPISKTASVYDPNLTIIYGQSLGYWGFLKDAYSFIGGRQHKRRSVSILTAKHIQLKTKPVQSIQADGEIIGKTPADIRIIKDAIRVLVPQQRPQGR